MTVAGKVAQGLIIWSAICLAAIIASAALADDTTAAFEFAGQFKDDASGAEI